VNVYPNEESLKKLGYEERDEAVRNAVNLCARVLKSFNCVINDRGFYTVSKILDGFEEDQGITPRTMPANTLILGPGLSLKTQLKSLGVLVYVDGAFDKYELYIDANERLVIWYDKVRYVERYVQAITLRSVFLYC